MAVRYNLPKTPHDSVSAFPHPRRRTPMNKLLALTAVLALAGCTTTSDVYLKNGEQGLTIDCSGEANSWASCYEKAGCLLRRHRLSHCRHRGHAIA